MLHKRVMTDSKAENRPLLGIIGGSGLYEIDGLEDVETLTVETPYGPPSDAYVTGRIGNQTVAFLPRHGKGHRIMPSELNFRANIFGFKKLGAGSIVSVSAVGSLREEVAPGDVVVPDQFIDRTYERPSTFFGGGIVAHVSLADPLCPELSAILADAASQAGATVHRGGTYVCIEGPQFSTRAESHLYRQWGADIIGMTNLQEARLAREAEICFTTMALATDYDCWRGGDEEVGVEDILAVLAANTDLAKRTVKSVAGAAATERACGCRRALDNALITNPEVIPPARRDALSLLIGRLLPADEEKDA